METKTIVRIGSHLAEWTPLGWKCDDPETAFFCAYAKRGSGVPKPFNTNYQRGEAERLLAVCREDKLDAEIISIGGSDDVFSDPDNPNLLF